MAAWRSTFAHSVDNESFDSEYEDEAGSPEQRENSSDMMSESDLSEISSVATAKSKSSTSRKPGRKAVWRETVITDMVDIICSSEHLRKKPYIQKHLTFAKHSILYGCCETA